MSGDGTRAVTPTVTCTVCSGDGSTLNLRSPVRKNRRKHFTVVIIARVVYCTSNLLLYPFPESLRTMYHFTSSYVREVR